MNLIVWLLLLQLKMLAILLAEIIFMTAVILIVMLVGHNHDVRTKIVGSLCVIFGTIMYGSPLSVMVIMFFYFILCFPSSFFG